MPTLNIEGVGKVNVSDDFTKLSPDEQNAFVDSIIADVQSGKKSSMGAKPEDPLRAAARKEIESLRAQGVPVDKNSLGSQAFQGMTFGFGDELKAAALAPIEAFRRGTGLGEGYKYAKAREDILTEDARKNNGLLGLGAEVLGGGAMAGRLAQGGLSLMRPNQGILGRIGAGIGEGVGYGLVSGAGEAKTAAEIPSEALKTAAIGGAVGGGITAAAPVVNSLGRNLMGWASASINPQGFANRQVARAINESQMTPQQIAQEVTAGNAAGQPYTVADAMGNAGQRMLSSVARAPGEGRTIAVNFLEARQGDQGRRMANILAEGLDAPQTAAQTREAMTRTRATAADTNYGAARAQAGAVDVSPAIAEADNFLQPGLSRLMNPGTNIADDSVEAAVRRARAYLTDGRSQITDFASAHRAKMELDAMIEGARPTVQRQLIPIRNALDNALAATSQPYAQARNQFRQQSQAIEAIDTGRTAAQRGRTEDTTRAFAGLSPEAQQGFRVGYADNLIEGVQGGAMGQNKARPFTSQAMQTELPTFAPAGRGQPMMERIGRENRMFETRAQALGGSRTADNLADMQATGVDPVAVLGNIAAGNVGAAARNLVGRSTGLLSGYTPQVRQELAGLLLSQNGGNLQGLLQQIAANDEARRRVLASYVSGLLGATGQGSATHQRSGTR